MVLINSDNEVSVNVLVGDTSSIDHHLSGIIIVLLDLLFHVCKASKAWNMSTSKGSALAQVFFYISKTTDAQG